MSEVAPQGEAGFRHEIRTIQNLDAFKATRNCWDKLVAAAECYSLCMTFPYCEVAAARVLDEGGHIEVVLVYHDADLVALWPFAVQHKGPLRLARILTNGSYQEYGQPLVKGTASRPVLEQTVRAILHIRADILQVPFVEIGSPLHESLQALQRRLVPSTNVIDGYTICLGSFALWDDFAATLPASLRRELRRSLKLLRGLGEVETGWCKTADDAEELLVWLFANKRRWVETRRKKAKWLADDKVRDFYIALAHRLDLSRTPLVAFVKVNNIPVAASVNVMGHTMEGNITTYDKEFSRYSVGTLLMEFVAKWTHATRLDFDLRLDAGYKARWADKITQYQSFVVLLSTRGRVLKFAFRARRALVPMLRSMRYK